MFFDARDIARIGAGEEGIGAKFGVERLDCVRLDQARGEHLIFFVASVAPIDRIGLAKRDFSGDPIEERFILRDFERKWDIH